MKQISTQKLNYPGNHFGPRNKINIFEEENIFTFMEGQWKQPRCYKISKEYLSKSEIDYLNI